MWLEANDWHGVIRRAYWATIMMDGVVWVPLKVMEDARGSVRRGLRNDESEYNGFGEAYFSSIFTGVVKGWKKHTRMHSNLIVVQGIVRFVVFDDRPESKNVGQVQEFVCSLQNYGRLSVPPGYWLAFQGLGEGANTLLNISNIVHDPQESLQRELADSRMPQIEW